MCAGSGDSGVHFLQRVNGIRDKGTKEEWLSEI